MAEAPAEKGPIPSISHEGNSDVRDILQNLCFRRHKILKSRGVTLISTIIMVVLYLWDCDPIPADVGVAYCISPYSINSHTVEPWSQERVTGSLTVWSRIHWQLSSVVAQSWTVFGWIQIVILVTATCILE